MVGALPPRQTSVASFGEFGVGSSNMMKPVDPKIFQTCRKPRNDAM